MPYFGFSQNYIPTKDVYDFDIGDEFHYERTFSGGYSKKTIKKILSKTLTTDSVSYQIHSYGVIDIYGSPQTRFGSVITEKYYMSDTIFDTIPPCLDTLHLYYSSYLSNFPSRIHCFLIDTIYNNTPYGNTYSLNNSDFEYNKNIYYSVGLGKSYFYEDIRYSLPPVTETNRIVYYKKDSLSLTLGNPWTFTTGLEENNLLDFSVYPNPANGFIKVNYSGIPNSYQYQLMNSLGQVLLSGKNEQNNIDVSSIPAGIYFLTITNEDGDSGVKRVVVSR